MRTFANWKLFLLLGFIILFLQACTEEVSQPAATQYSPEQASQLSTKVLLNEEANVDSVEVASQALGVWRKYSQWQPTLLLLSNDPMLLPVPDEVWPDAARVIAMADEAALSSAVAPESSDPLLLPIMTLDVALRSGWFGEVAWAVPLRDLTDHLNPIDVGQQLLEKRLVDKQEAASLAKVEEVIQGKIREIPFKIGALSELSNLQSPIIVHIDQGYFQQLYKNEIATPLLTVVLQTLQLLSDMNLPVLAVTFSNGNLSERIALDVRFLKDVLSEVISRPELLEQPLSKKWQRQADVLYLQNFFEKERVKEIAEKMLSDDPESAYVYFTLYRVYAENKLGTEALDALAQAVALDKVYAMEYLALSKMAFDKGRPDEAMRMLGLANEAFPDNPKIRLQMAQLATEMGDKKTALHLVEQLQQLEWSPVYYQGMVEYLDDFAAFLKGEQQQSPAQDPRRQRILK